MGEFVLLLLLLCVFVLLGEEREGENADYVDVFRWLNAEAREYVFDQETLDGECFLKQEEEVAVAGGYAPTSTEADVVTGKL